MMNQQIQQLRYSWNHFTRIFRLLNRKAELKRLIKWAKRKKYNKPLRLYRTRLEDTELLLLRNTVKNPKIFRRIRMFHFLAHLIIAEPKYPKKGIAAHYRYKNRISVSSKANII